MTREEKNQLGDDAEDLCDQLINYGYGEAAVKISDIIAGVMEEEEEEDS